VGQSPNAYKRRSPFQADEAVTDDRTTMTQGTMDLVAERKAAEKRRLAEALRANLRRRKTARESSRPAGQAVAGDHEDRG
jgi:hypothetical protein